MEEVSTGTLNIGIKYNSGILLMSDRQITLGNEIADDMLKIETISPNIGISWSGALADCQLIYRTTAHKISRQLDLLNEYLNKILENTIKSQKEEKRKKPLEKLIESDLEKKIAWFYRHKQTKVFIKPDSNTYQFDTEYPITSGDSLEPKIIYPLNSFSFHLKENGEILIGTEALAHYIGDQVRKEKNSNRDFSTGFILGGYDLDGLQLFSIGVKGSVMPVKEYTAKGSGMTQATPLLDALYQKEMKAWDALILGTFVIMQSSERARGVNEKVDALFIYQDKEQIKRIYVNKSILIKMRQSLDGQKGKIPETSLKNPFE